MARAKETRGASRPEAGDKGGDSWRKTFKEPMPITALMLAAAVALLAVFGS